MINLFDNTMLSTFKLCPKKFYYRMVKHLNPIKSENYKAEYGVAFHKAMDVWYTTKDKDKSTKAFINSWLPFEGMDNTNLRNVVNGIKLINEYIEIYKNEPFTVKEVEINFTVELDKVYMYHGKCDGLVEYNDGNLYILEHKTSAAKGYLSTNPNHQIDGYIFGVNQITHSKVKGCIFNQVYLAKKSNDFVRELTIREDKDILSFINDTLYWMKQVTNCEDINNWPKNTNNCNAYWKACEYKVLCTCNDEALQTCINSLYVKDEWLASSKGDNIAA